MHRATVQKARYLQEKANGMYDRFHVTESHFSSALKSEIYVYFYMQIHPYKDP